MNDRIETTDFRDLFRELQDRKHPDYYQRPIPSDLDTAVGGLVSVFIDGEAETRERLLSASRKENSFTLIVFAERMATLAVRESSPRRIRDGLVALIIEGFKFDYRDNMCVWAPLYHSAVKLGADPDLIFREAASLANTEVSRWLIDFANRPAPGKSLKVFGFTEGYGPDGFRYERLP